jgi:hypothetical protein
MCGSVLGMRFFDHTHRTWLVNEVEERQKIKGLTSRGSIYIFYILCAYAAFTYHMRLNYGTDTNFQKV